MVNGFGDRLSRLRKKAGLTNLELAELADVSKSLIPGLQSGKRHIGEFQARKIGVALGLNDAELDDFIFQAINQCSRKVLRKTLDYPAELLNLLALQLRKADILPEAIRSCSVTRMGKAAEAAITIDNGSVASLRTELTFSG